MFRKFLKSKIHSAIVTGADLHYEGSIAIDQSLLDEVDLRVNESVHVWNVSNGQRIETYVISAPAGSGEVCLNGAAARLFEPGDRVIIASFCWLDDGEVAVHKPKIVVIGADNREAKRV